MCSRNLQRNHVNTLVQDGKSVTESTLSAIAFRLTCRNPATHFVRMKGRRLALVYVVGCLALE